MRYSIFEYSQEKLVSLGLDVTDALLLNWFANFFCGKMEKQMFKDGGGKTKIYGWIKISKVIEDLPVIGITSEKGIRKRFDTFVEKGILDKKTLFTHNGKKSYYRTTAIYESLINTTAIQKNQEKENADPEHTRAETRGESASPHPETSSASSEADKNANGIRQRNDSTFANSENARNDLQRNSSTYGQRNGSTFAQGNSGSLALNDSLTNDKFVKDIAAASERHFGKNAFDANFTQKAAAFLSSQKVSDIDFYFKFIKDKVSEKISLSKSTVSSPRGLAYRLFFQTDIAQEAKDKQQQFFLEEQRRTESKAAEEKRKVCCPVCGTRFLPSHDGSCPKCEFSVSYFQNETEIKIHSRFIRLPEKSRQNYERRLRQIYKFDIARFMAMSQEEKDDFKSKQKIDKTVLDKEFGLIT